ncbi:MAG: cardiolipin synthase [Porticoccus sp.]|nr:cardiolipin synthase [Porticoccus sp.]MBQ0808441.1 cardiolipin synthase [Porticoccus sp.]
MDQWLSLILDTLSQGGQLLAQFWVPLFALMGILGVLLAIESIFKSRTSQGAIAWALGLVFLSPIVVPVYLLFGQRKFYGYVEARRKGDLEIQQIAEKLMAEMNTLFSPEEGGSQGASLLEKLALMPFTKGNKVGLLVNGEQTFSSIFEAIDKATHYILLQFYIVRDDQLGRELQEKLIEKARQGVRIYFLYDAIGSFSLSRRYLKKCRQAGIHIEPFRTWRWGKRRRFQINFRNHRKIVVVDGCTAFVGGSNIGDEYLNRDGRLSPWRDTQVRMEGPSVQGCQLSFIEDWYWVTSEVPEMDWHPDGVSSDQRILILPTGPADRVETCQLMFLHAINSATERLWIVGPYFVPDESIIKALKLAALRGVDIRLMLPGKTDNRMVQFSSYAALLDLRNTGIRAFQYQQGFLHQKVVLVDSDRAYVGTANFDNRSFHLNFELTVMVRGQQFASEVESMLNDDFNHCLPLTGEELAQRSVIFRSLVKFSHLFSPIQ